MFLKWRAETLRRAQTERCFAVRSQPAKSRERRKEVKNNQEKNSGLKETEANLKMDVVFKHNIHLGKVGWKLGNLTSVNPEETISNGTQFYQRVLSNIRITRNQYEKSWLNSLPVEITQKLFIRRPCLPKEAFFVLPQMLRCSFLKQVFFSSPLKTYNCFCNKRWIQAPPRLPRKRWKESQCTIILITCKTN